MKTIISAIALGLLVSGGALAQSSAKGASPDPSLNSKSSTSTGVKSGGAPTSPSGVAGGATVGSPPAATGSTDAGMDAGKKPVPRKAVKKKRVKKSKAKAE